MSRCCAASNMASTEPGAEVQKTDADVVPLRNSSATKKLGDSLGVLVIIEFGFGREGVFVQPLEQLRAVAADDLYLRIMNMRVDEARHQDRARIASHYNVFRHGGQNLVSGSDCGRFLPPSMTMIPSDS